jgi:hypothetical protein
MKRILLVLRHALVFSLTAFLFHSIALAQQGMEGDLYATINGNTRDNGGFVYQYDASLARMTFISGLSRPRGIGFDRCGNLFVATNMLDENGNFQGTILKFSSGGVQTVFATADQNLAFSGLALDGSGNLYAAAQDVNFQFTNIYKFTPQGARSIFATVPVQSFQLAFDQNGNLYGASGDGIDRFTPSGAKTIFVPASAFAPNTGPIGLAFDSAGNLFVSTESNDTQPDTILEFDSTGAFVQTFATGLQNPRGLAFDSAGNLYVAEVPGNGYGPGSILRFAPDGTETVVDSGLGRPSGNGGAEYLAFPDISPKTTSISANFNGTGISAGKTIWFSGVMQPKNLGSAPVTFRFTNQTITLGTTTISVPAGTVTFDPAATTATTTFTGGMWQTTAPISGLSGNTFFAGVAYMVPSNLSGGIKNVKWSATISVDSPGASLQWKWAAAVYNNFGPDYNSDSIKPVDDNKASAYQNSDHAGTPENYKASVTGGATGGGGSNYTGSLSGTIEINPCQ